MRGRIVGFMLAMLWPAWAAAAEEGLSSLGMTFLETPELKLIWFEPLGYLAPHVIQTHYNALRFQKRLLGWEPSERTTALLKDQSDYGMVAASEVPRNRLFFDIAPLSHAFETYPASERIYSWMNHETVHLAQADIANDVDRRYRRLFMGKVAPQREHPETLLYGYLTAPRLNVPRWYLEGAAVFFETWMGGGLGRAQGGYDEMVFRAMVRDGAHFFDPLGLESRGVRSDFQIGANAYLYGTRFITWLAYEYSPEKVIEWMRRDQDSERHYVAQFRKVFGIELDEAWRRWIEFEQEFQRRNLAEIRKYPITPHRKLVDRPMGSISRVYFDESEGKLYGGFRMPGTIDYVSALDTRTGVVTQLADIKRAMLYRVTSFAFDPDSRTAFYTSDNTGLRDLMAVDVRTGQSRMLMEDARIGELASNRVDRSLIGVRHALGYAVLVRIPYPYTEWQTLHVFPYGVVPYDLAVSPDGKLLSASVSELNGDQFLRVWPLERVAAGDLKPLSEFRFGQSVPESFVFSRDGRHLYGSSYYTGVSNIFRYDVASGEVEAVSNTDSDFFRPFPLADGRLLVLTYTSAGFVPAVIDPVTVKDASAIRFLGTEVARKHPVVTQWQVDPAAAVDDEKMVQRRGHYEPRQHLALDSAFPVIQGYKDTVSLGYRFNVADPLSFASVDVTLGRSVNGSLPSDELAHFEINGRYLGWWSSLSWNRADFYDLFGPVKRSRKGLAVKGGYEHYIHYDDPRFFTLVAQVGFYDKIDTLPNAQNIESGFDRLTEAEVGLRYADVRKSLGAVDDEKGIKWSAYAGVQHVTGETPWYVRGNLDYGWDIPPGNSSIWLRTAGGYVSGNPDVPISNFYLGGFGNNYVDSREIKRYRDMFSYPGFGIDAISGQSFVRPMIEWNVTPYVFESLGTPAFHLAWMRPGVFASALWTDVESSSKRKNYGNVGTQVDFNVTVLHYYPMTLSFGYALGFGKGRRSGGEWMASLKIM
jgi:hypothetical protein